MKIKNFKNEGIYVLLNVVNKESYIGSSTNLGNRKTKHISLLKNGKHENHLLQKAVKTYGIENFQFGILKYCDKNLKKEEQFYIDKYKPSYNITKDAINNTPSLSSRKKMSITRKKLYKEGILKPKGKAILQYDLENNFIKEFPTVASASRKLNIDKGGIHRVLSKKYKQMKGFKFEYKLQVL